MKLKELKALLKYFKDNNILLIDGDNIGNVKLPLINEYFISDCLIDENINGVKIE